MWPLSYYFSGKSVSLIFNYNEINRELIYRYALINDDTTDIKKIEDRFSFLSSMGESMGEINYTVKYHGSSEVVTFNNDYVRKNEIDSLNKIINTYKRQIYDKYKSEPTQLSSAIRYEILNNVYDRESSLSFWLAYLFNFLPLFILWLTSPHIKLNFQNNSFSAIDDKAQQKKTLITENTDLTFVKYFTQLKALFETEMEAANSKASLLLARGIIILVLSMIVYVGIIGLFQWFLDSKEIKLQHILGITSTTILFVFVQFIGAWFLKQYRYFVDTSTYYMKLKVNIDRFMFVYLTTNEMQTSPEHKKELTDKFITFMMQDIKYPDTYIGAKGDLNLAKETLDNLTNLIKSVSESIKGNGKEEKEKP
jgi:hypothetical protein